MPTNLDPEFRIISNLRRADARLSPITQALMEGRTVLLPPGKQAANYGATLRRHGFQIHQHRADDGLVVWAERIEPNGRE